MTNVSQISARMNSTYRCLSSASVSLDAGVNVTFANVRMEAYMTSANLSKDGTEFQTLKVRGISQHHVILRLLPHLSESSF